MSEAGAVERYIASFPPPARNALETLRAAIRDVLPDAVETMSYGIPTFRLGGRNVVHLGGWKEHVSLYPIPEADSVLEEEMRPYRAGKGTLRFALGEPVPVALVERVVVALRQQRAG